VLGEAIASGLKELASRLKDGDVEHIDAAQLNVEAARQGLRRGHRRVRLIFYQEYEFMKDFFHPITL